MSRTDQSFSALRQAILSLWPDKTLRDDSLQSIHNVLLLTLPHDIAAFTLSSAKPEEDYTRAYSTFKGLYRENNIDWDTKSLSFVMCRSGERASDDRFYASLEHDPLFCRKYVIRAHQEIPAQLDELLRLPFLPLRTRGEHPLQRPQSAQDLLQSAGVSASLSRKFVEAGHRSADRIATDLREGNESLPDSIARPQASRVALATPRAHSRLVSLTVEGFRAYRDVQTFDLDASVVVLYGPNGLGKTSFFDALDYASTGRIGRLCNHQRRSQADFSRLATHLDKTPGSGSVEIRMRSAPVKESNAEWKVQRNTGNWSNAWLDGGEVDRKTVINRLTHANWVESSPRQQTLESLFRATHLFGQDEQELLTEFQKGSVIPEAFISEMLALQDYSQALAKVTEVIEVLEKHRKRLADETLQVRSQFAELNSALSVSPDEGSEAVLPIERALAELRQDAAHAGIADTLPADSSSVHTFREWLEIIAARLAAVEARVGLAKALITELPVFSGHIQQEASLRKRIKDIDAALEACNVSERDLDTRLALGAAAIREADLDRQVRERRRKELQTFSELRGDKEDVSKRTAGLQAERDQQILARSELDAKLAAIETGLSVLHANYSVAAEELKKTRALVGAFDGLTTDLAGFARDRELDVELAQRIVRASLDIETAVSVEAGAALQRNEITRSREALLPEYERALSSQADLERLLDSIQIHVRSKTCPLCGSEFDSVESLSRQIARQRESITAEPDVTVQYKKLVSLEGHASDALRAASSDLSAKRTALRELETLKRSAETRLATFSDRLSKVGVKVAADQISEVLVERLGEGRRRESEQSQIFEKIRHERTALQDAKAHDAARRAALVDRITSLEREAKTLLNRGDELESRIGEIRKSLSPMSGNDDEVQVEAAQVSAGIDESIALLERLNSERQRETDASEAVKSQKRNYVENRATLAHELSVVQGFLQEYRQRLRSLDILDPPDAKKLSQSAQLEETAAERIRAVFERGQVLVKALRAREARLQLMEKQAQASTLSKQLKALESGVKREERDLSACKSIERLLSRERENAVAGHIDAYGPMITKIQQRLRSVYGFGGVHLEARGGEAAVKVEWRNKEVHVPPTDFFSDSQKQILMLSIFLAGGLRQNWSGFAPMLLDDPVTHFDDLNAYGFVELVRGIIFTSPNEWQFIISTCEERLFSLMQRKFRPLPSGAIFYEFVGMTESGPLVERR